MDIYIYTTQPRPSLDFLIIVTPRFFFCFFVFSHIFGIPPGKAQGMQCFCLDRNWRYHEGYHDGDLDGTPNRMFVGLG